jgi:hypothetical protein
VQAAGVGVGVDGRGLLERAAIGDLDAQLPVIDAIDQPGELGGVTADEDPLRADSPARVVRPENHCADMETRRRPHR